MTRTPDIVQAELEQVRGWLTDALDPSRAESIRRGDREIRRGSAAQSIAEIRRRIRELEAELARLTGRASPYGPVGV